MRRQPHNQPNMATDAQNADLAHLDNLARLMDSRFSLFGIRFGLDGLLGLIPGVGDAVTLVPAGYVLYHGWRSGARKRTLARMAANSGADAVIGAIPLVGDAFDIVFKANRRNVDMLRAELTREGRKPRR